MKTVENL